jgi:pimeloyl-ACP methyl ester carboxylesterase
VINPGGPGESGVESAYDLLTSLTPRVRKGFDLVGFDPRGIGISRAPTIIC